MLFFIVFLCLHCLCLGIQETENGYLINVIRQKTPMEQYFNYGHHLKGNLGDLLKKGDRDNDSIPLYRFLDDEFYGKIVIGHPGQTLNVAFDTTWDLAWVISSKCSSIFSVGCWFHNKYDHTKSSEYKKDGRPYALDLGNFTMKGFYSYDNISVSKLMAGLPAMDAEWYKCAMAHSNVTGFSFVEMVDIPKNFILNKVDGVLGLGLKTKNSAYTPFFYTLLQQKKIKNPIFSIYLNRDQQSNRGGNVMLGFVDDKHIHKTRINNVTIRDNFTYLSLNNPDSVSYWQFNMDKIIVDNKAESLILCDQGCNTTVDTSANTIIGPKKDVDQIHDAMKASEFFFNRYTVECDTTNKLPPISFVLAGKNFTLKGPDYTVKMSYHSITVCVSAFVPATTNQEFDRWILGGAFLSEYYSVYNVEEKSIGFVKAA